MTRSFHYVLPSFSRPNIGNDQFVWCLRLAADIRRRSVCAVSPISASPLLPPKSPSIFLYTIIFSFLSCRSSLPHHFLFPSLFLSPLLAFRLFSPPHSPSFPTVLPCSLTFSHSCHSHFLPVTISQLSCLSPSSFVLRSHIFCPLPYRLFSTRLIPFLLLFSFPATPTLFSQNPLCFSHPAVQNLHPSFYYVLTLASSCAIVTLVLTIPGTGLPR